MLFAEGKLLASKNVSFENDEGKTIDWFSNYLRLTDGDDSSTFDILEVGSRTDFSKYIDEESVFTLKQTRVQGYPQFKLQLVKITPNKPLKE